MFAYAVFEISRKGVENAQLKVILRTPHMEYSKIKDAVFDVLKNGVDVTTRSIVVDVGVYTNEEVKDEGWQLSNQFNFQGPLPWKTVYEKLTNELKE
jgi:hypothetical protein